MSQTSHPSTAQFLLRFDDLCPGMDPDRWNRFLPLLERHRIRPILAVVPDNHDPELEQTADHHPGDSQEFWPCMRLLQKSGCAIALHGYRHLCQSLGKSIVPIHSRSEFAGVEENRQRVWIKAGVQLLKEQDLNPQLWVAPRHGFDIATIRALASENIRIISDGFATAPFQWHGATWIPQQLWAPEEKTSGLWTICIHPATTSDDQVLELETFLARHSEQFTTIDRVLKEWPIQDRSWEDRFFQAKSLLRIRASRLKRRLIAPFQ